MIVERIRQRNIQPEPAESREHREVLLQVRHHLHQDRHSHGAVRWNAQGPDEFKSPDTRRNIKDLQAAYQWGVLPARDELHPQVQ